MIVDTDPLRPGVAVYTLMPLAYVIDGRIKLAGASTSATVKARDEASGHYALVTMIGGRRVTIREVTRSQIERAYGGRG